MIYHDKRKVTATFKFLNNFELLNNLLEKMENYDLNLRNDNELQNDK